MESPKVLVEAKGLHKKYGEFHAVRGVNFQVTTGEVVGFLGPNGAGKSTTMKMLTGYLRASEGHAKVAGYSVVTDPLQAQTHLGYLPESAPMYPEMMVADFLRFVCDLRQVSDADRKKRLPEICRRCGLDKVLGKDIGHLSKGYRQRVGLAQALVHDPELLILDEPTSGLDPNQIIEIRSLIRDLGQEKTVLLSTHILPEVQATCNRIIIINEGKIVADDKPENLTGDAAGAVVRVVVKAKTGASWDPIKMQSLMADLPGVRGVDKADGEGERTLGFCLRSSGDPREALFAKAVSEDFVLLTVNRERASLEDTFRRLTQTDNAKGGSAHV